MYKNITQSKLRVQFSLETHQYSINSSFELCVIFFIICIIVFLEIRIFNNKLAISKVFEKYFFLLSIYFFAQALPIERCPQFRDQPPGSTATYNGKCYIFYNRQPMIFREALSFCRARGGTLVDESNPALQGFISWELWRRHR